jgi:predicted GIY-YIG superfamily endonuclease
MTIYSVYWIHYPEHKNIQTDGYVGISKNPTRRFNEHKRSELSNQYSGVGSKELMYVISGKQKQHKGWRFITLTDR